MTGPPNADIIPVMDDAFVMIAEAFENPPPDSPRCAGVRLRAIPGAADGPEEGDAPDVAASEGAVGAGGARMTVGKRLGVKV